MNVTRTATGFTAICTAASGAQVTIEYSLDGACLSGTTLPALESARVRRLADAALRTLIRDGG